MAGDYREKGLSVPIPDKQAIEQIIARGDAEVLVKWADQIGQAIARQVTSSQLRNVFGTARQIQLRWSNDPDSAYRDAVLLRPKLGYFAKRERGRGMADLERVLVPALEEMSQGKDPENRKQRFDRFLDFFEAIVAYHKKYGGN
ncbi:MAG: type III-A CRISPR-associated protein Csm2 [Chloroflexota bacterium]